jgi:formate hydrogenlyase subunit 6/NADH:ubiquinone oxidoreductase subunit I
LANLSLDYAACVLTSNKSAGCTKCEAVCPADVIRIEEHTLTYTPAECIRCGACQGVCPTESFKIDGFAHENFVAEFVADESDLISCKKNIPCLAALNAEYLISLALEKGRDIILDTGYCEGCEIAVSVMGHIEDSLEEANRFLEAFRTAHRIKAETVAYDAAVKKGDTGISRRQLFSKLNVKDAVKAKLRFDKEVDVAMRESVGIEKSDYDRNRVREKQLPFRRSLFISATRGLEGGADEQLESKDFSFITDKVIDKTRCTNCALCYHVCPTGALVGERLKGKIAFDFLHCVACNSCHDICPEFCLGKETSFTKGMFTQPERKKLATFFMRQCADCGMPYINDGHDICSRCRAMDDEARDLVGF